jgi:hypothetical protein
VEGAEELSAEPEAVRAESLARDASGEELEEGEGPSAGPETIRAESIALDIPIKEFAEEGERAVRA